MSYDPNAAYDNLAEYDTTVYDVVVIPPDTGGGGTRLVSLRELYQVLVRDASLQVVGELSTCVKLEAVPVFNGVGTWIIDVPQRNLPLLPPGGGLVITRGEQPLIAGPFTSLRPSRNGDAPDGTLELAGVSDDVVIADRLIYPVPTSVASSQAASAYDLRTGVAETVVKAYVNLNAGPGALAVRQVPAMTVEPDQGRGSSVTGNYRFDNLADSITALLALDGLGWRVDWVAGSLQFLVYAPDDLSAAVRFSWDLGNLRNQTYTLTAPAATREIVAGGGEGTARIFHERGDVIAESVWMRRIERFVDRRDTTDAATLDQAGDQALLDDGAKEQFEITVADTDAATYGRDYQLGDKVTVIGDASELSDIVRSCHFTVTVDGELIEPLIGTPNAASDQQPAATRALVDLLRAVNDQARRR